MLSIILKVKTAAVFLAVVLTVSCGRTVKTFEVIDLTEPSEIYDIACVEMDSLILDVGNGSVTGMIDKVHIMDDGYLVSTGGRMLLYGKDGKFKGQIGRLGRAGNEYVSYSDSWVLGEKVFLYDMNSRKVISYSMDGAAIDVFPVDNSGSGYPFSFLAPFGEGYIGRCVWNGTTGESPALAYYDDSFMFVRAVGNLTIKSGLRLGYPLVEAENSSLLYWNPLGRDIYRICPDHTVAKVYEITFGSARNYPSLESIDEYDLLDLARDDVWRDAHSGPVTYVWESDPYLIFLYYRGKELHMCCYDKHKKHVMDYRFPDFGKDILLSCAFDGKRIHFFTEEAENVEVRIMDVI